MHRYPLREAVDNSHRVLCTIHHGLISGVLAELDSRLEIERLDAFTEPQLCVARLACLRWQVELDYRQLKGEVGLDHYEGRSYPGFHHHTALVTCAHAFLTEERLWNWN